MTTSRGGRDLPPLLTLVAAAVAVALVGWADYATGTELRIFPLYFFPVALTALRWGRLAGVSFAVLAAVGWAASNLLVGLDGLGAATALANAGVMLGTFLLVALLLARQGELLARERTLSRADALTGLANTRSFFELAEIELARSARYGHPLTIAYLDLDDFKAINDEHGHATGDALLTEVAAVLRLATRPSDVVARLGGDEFAVLLPETGTAAAEAAVGKLQRLVDDTLRRRDWPVTVSIGAVIWETPPASADELVRSADALMYEVKSAGKRGVRCERARSGTADRPAATAWRGDGPGESDRLIDHWSDP